MHTLFSTIETIDDIDTAIDRLVFDGIIAEQETENNIRHLTHQAFSLRELGWRARFQ